jgi:hypothetical protein
MVRFNTNRSLGWSTRDDRGADGHRIVFIE